MEEELIEAQKHPETHYDAAKEVRAKGAAFYQFSADEETRKQQMEELQSAREETKKTREEMGAVNVLPGEVEGMRADETGSTNRALEKRKRDIESRRALLEAKRKKPKIEGSAPSSQPVSQSQTPPAFYRPNDPFAALESRASKPPSREAKTGARSNVTSTVDADAFLAQLEQEVLMKRK